MMTLTPEDLTTLKAAFSFSDHEFTRGFCYLTEEAISNRVEEVDPAWSFEIQNLQRIGDQCVCAARLTIKGISREGVGMQSIELNKEGRIVGEPEKGAATDALKRCARLFGIGRYILGAPKEGQQFKVWLADKQRETASRPTPRPSSSPVAVVAPAASNKPPKTTLDAVISPMLSELETMRLDDPAFAEGFGARVTALDGDDLPPNVYRVTQAMVTKQGKSHMYLLNHGGDRHITLFSGDQFRAIGLDPDVWKAKSGWHPVSLLVTADFDGKSWDVSDVKRADGEA